jgi:hypothetical protein
MIVDNSKVLLFIEPRLRRSAEPVDDFMTLFLQKLLDAAAENPQARGHVTSDGQFIRGLSTMGRHHCVCKEKSDSCDYEILPGWYTNSLADHYLRWHRAEVPQEELDKITQMMTLS